MEEKDIIELENLGRRKSINDETSNIDEDEVMNSDADISTDKNHVVEKTEVDGRHKNDFASKKIAAEGMMDIALLTANANQLRFLITYNYDSKTYFVNLVLIITSLILQVAVGMALIVKRRMKNRGDRTKVSIINDFLVGGVFIVTVINVFVAAFTTTEASL